MHQAVVVDGDGHVMEPEDLWLRYLEPQWRDRAIRIARDAQGIENLLINGRGHELVRGKLGTLGGIGMQEQSAARLMRKSEYVARSRPIYRKGTRGRVSK